MKRSNVIQSFLSLSVMATVCFSMSGCIATKDIGVDTESETAEGGAEDSMSVGETTAASESQGGSSMSSPGTQGGSDSSAGSETDSTTASETDVIPETESDSDGSGGSDSSGIADSDTDSSGELDPIDMCAQTGGTWDETSCGHYTCGFVPDCDAVIPGCDCGEGQVFGPGGCEESLECVSLACGELVCAPADEICSVFVSGVKGGGNSYACDGLPEACADDPTCDCIEPLLKNGSDCEDVDGGGVVVTTYGA